VLLTGHTGFKGSWLALWLQELGAQVTKLALPPDTEPNLFAQLGLEQRLDHRVGDIRDADRVASLVIEVRPQVLLHLAAQPLVRLSYAEPTATWATNVMGSIHLLEALRRLQESCKAGGADHHRQGVPQQRVALRLPRRRPARRPCPLQQQQGGGGTEDRQLACQFLRQPAAPDPPSAHR
jgi:hypothetical protein